MCMNDEALLTELRPKNVASSSPPGVRMSSTVSSSSSDGSESDDSRDVSGGNSMVPIRDTNAPTAATKGTIARRRIQPNNCISGKEQRPSWRSIVSSASLGILNATFWIIFSLYFPFILAPEAATKTYHQASFQYVDGISHFDTTAWTYGTDYALAVIMALLVASILRYSRPNVSDRLSQRSASLLILYGVSVTAGGIAHQNFVTLESRNTLAFRFLWTVCVGTVCSASCSMGMIGTEAVQRFQEKSLRNGQKTLDSSPSSLLLRVPVLSETFWIAFGSAVTAFCAAGGLSFQRPACDIFVAGITQSPSTFYCMIFFFAVQHPRVATWAKVTGLVGFILNAPLLPMYPLLVQYTDLSLASVNTLLHSWLCVAWSMQGISMQHVIQALVADDEEENRVSVQSTPSAKKMH
ncbi:hypothetical protein IV203_007987 [Nitzschia inconspicua]|uniref:Uncharacterized protein n=1 Tax=Nitzschia inconspicua TaxID=303405 RepID=A0A9K3KYU3_9STRA|nr:hypothetical protein IV203_007987 [Nitzschia inconspicua]